MSGRDERATEVSSRSSAHRRRRIGIAASIGAVVALSAGTAFAASVTPSHIGGSNNDGKRCADVIAGSTALKDVPPTSGVYTDGVLSVTITVTSGSSFDWTSNIAVLGVVVKDGEDGANFYDYRPAGSTGDTNLTTPGPEFGGTFKNISHINFCYLKGPDELTEALAVTKTAATEYDRTHHWDLEKSVDASELFLYTDGSGDATVEWTVDVSYDGSTDSGHNVSGTITIENVGDLDATITGVEDVLDLSTDPDPAVELDCGATFPLVLAVDGIVQCTYSEELGGASEGSNTASVTTERTVYSSDPVDLVWGDPANETDKTVTVGDLSDLFGDVDLGSFTAPNDGSFTYDKHFAWADYDERDECGDFTYDNTATLYGDEDAVLDTDSESVDVHVQCLIFQGETAWAANEHTAGEKPYNKNTNGNWATFVKYEGVEATGKTTTLFAGQHLDAGSVTFSPKSASNTVTITVTLDSPWEYADVVSSLKVQGYNSKPGGNPAPGQFANKVTCDVSSSTCSVTVPYAKYFGVHVSVGQLVPDPNFP